MNSASKRLLTALVCGVLTAAGSAAHADRGDDRRWSHADRHQRGHYDDHYDRRYDKTRTIIRERVVIREVPRYYRQREVREYYYAPPVRSYGYRSDPALVIGLSIPPIVIPLR